MKDVENGLPEYLLRPGRLALRAQASAEIAAAEKGLAEAHELRAARDAANHMPDTSSREDRVIN